MKKPICWKEKYHLALKEEMTISDIMLLRDCGRPRAASIRNKCIEFATKKGISLEGRAIPVELVFEVTGKNLEFYYQQMINESKYMQ